MAGFRAAGAWRPVFDGQSLNNIAAGPELITPTATYPFRAMASRGLAWSNVAVDGESWTVLAATAATRLWPLLTGPETSSVLIMCGGTADLNLESDSAATVYANMADYADAAKTAGADLVIGTTITPATPLTGPKETARTGANALLLADARGSFDHVVDFAGTTGLDDHTSQFYAFDGIHLSWLGAQLAADTMAPTLDAIFA